MKVVLLLKRDMKVGWDCISGWSRLPVMLLKRDQGRSRYR